MELFRVLGGCLPSLIPGDHRLAYRKAARSPVASDRCFSHQLLQEQYPAFPVPEPRRATGHFRRSSPSSFDGSSPSSEKYSAINGGRGKRRAFP